jgi:hypothetical protein
LVRLPDWPERLALFLERRSQAPFEWGGNDCITHAADAVFAMTNQDPLGKWRGAWRTEADAQATLACVGGLEAAVCSVLGAPLVSLMWAGRGDVCLVRLPTGTELLGLCLGTRWVAPAEGGPAARGPMSMATLAWAVGARNEGGPQ